RRETDMSEPARTDFRHAQSGGDAADAVAPGIDQRFAKVAAANPDPQFGSIRDHARGNFCGPLVHTANVRYIHEFLAHAHERTALRRSSTSALAPAAARSQA